MSYFIFVIVNVKATSFLNGLSLIKKQTEFYLYGKYFKRKVTKTYISRVFEKLQNKNQSIVSVCLKKGTLNVQRIHSVFIICKLGCLLFTI